jgi:hypothetical protein
VHFSAAIDRESVSPGKFSEEIFDSHENFFSNRFVIKYYAISHGHIGDGHREIQEIGAHRRDMQTFDGAGGSGKNICCRS